MTGALGAPKVGGFGLCMPGGSLRLAADDCGEPGAARADGPPMKPPCCPVKPPGCCTLGAPCRDNEKAFILACMSEFSPLARAGGGPGLLAALVGPSGADEGLIEDVRLPLLCGFSDGGLVGD
jgi:hypothetical protein